MTTTHKTEHQESDLQNRLKQVEYDTLDGSKCRATITDITEKHNRIGVNVELPSGRTHTESFDIPEVASDEYEFVRLLQTTGYGLSALDHAIGADVTVEITDDGPEIVVPEPSRSLSERLATRVPQEAIVGVGFALIVLTFPITGKRTLVRWDPSLDNHPGPLFTFWLLGFACWFLLVAGLLTALLGVAT